MADKKQEETQKKQAIALDEDDEFEEFEEENWSKEEQETENELQWEDDWDDEQIDDDFSKQLRAELEKVAQTPQPMKI